MPDPTDVFLVRGSLQLLEGESDMKETRAVLMVCGATTTLTYTVPADCHLVNVVPCETSTQWTLGLDGRTRVQLLTTGRVEEGTLLAWYNAQATFNLQNSPLKKGTRLIMTNTAAAPQAIMLYFTD